MSEPRDAFDLLHETNPVVLSEVEGPDSPRAEALLASILATPRPPSERRALLPRRLRVVIVLAAVIAATTAAAWIWTRRIELPQSVICFESVDLESDRAGGPSSASATAEACEVVWQDGILHNPVLGPPGSVPPLTACVAESGALAVFPTDDSTVCRTLGLADPEPSGQEDADRLRQLSDGLITYFQSSPCIGIEEAEREVRRMLAEAGLDNWAVQSQPAPVDRPCASHSLDPRAETVHLVPIPKPGG
jgi:hypothetical protein